MSHRVIHSDCVEAMRAMPEASVDAVVCDPPYGLEFMGKDWDAPWKAGFSEVSFRDGFAPPNFSSNRNPVCRACRKHKRGTKRCGCATPDYDETPADSSRLFQAWCAGWAAEALRVLKPGGHLLAFGGTRTYHRMACAIEDAGFEIRDSLHWVYGSGFPKSLDVSKAIDANLGAERRVIGPATRHGGGASEIMVGDYNPARTAPGSSEAAAWDGWGTALKPAHEPIVLARRPLGGTVAANVLAHGTGGLNVDGCRIHFASEDDKAAAAAAAAASQRASQDQNAGRTAYGRFENGPASIAPYLAGLDAGRWPPNLLLDEHAAAEMDRQSGTLQSGQLLTHHKRSGTPQIGTFEIRDRTGEPCDFGGDSGGASRFFPVFRYVAKPARAERDAGCHDLAARSAGEATDRTDDTDGLKSPRAGAGRTGGARNIHPTVKPIALMEWLVRLVTPPGGTVLDPFLGSGTTGCAAVREGFNFIGIEREAEYVAIAERRIAAAANAPRAKPLRAQKSDAPEGQLSLLGGAA